MRLHGILTIVALLLIAGGALPMLMGETMSLTGEHDGAMFGELLFTVGTDPYYVGDFKHTNIHESSLQLYGVMGGVEIPVTLDDIDYENGRYALNYLLSLDTNQVLNLDGTYADGVFTDLSGNGNHGTPYNGATTGTGVVGDGMSFDASSSQYISINYPVIREILGSKYWSVSGWYEPDADVSYSCLLSYGASSGSEGWLHIQRYSTYDIFRCRYTTTDDGTSILSNNVINVDGYWVSGIRHQYTVIRDNTNLYVYLDGELSGSSFRYVSGTIVSTNPVLLGRYSSSSTWKYDGMQDEVRIYDRALTPDEVSYLNDCVDVSNIEYPYGTEIYASYTYSDTFAPIGSDLFGLGVSLVGCVMLIGVIVGSSGRW